MLSPLDIQSKIFTKSVSGYNKAEVDDFMQMVLTDYEKLYRENIGLKDRINVLSDGINHYKSIEDTMQSTLIAAQSMGEELKRNAEDKAKIIVDEASLKAREILDTAKTELAKTVSQHEERKKTMEIFRAKTIASLNAQIKSMQDDDTI